jgi:type III secretion protein C
VSSVADVPRGKASNNKNRGQAMRRLEGFGSRYWLAGILGILVCVNVSAAPIPFKRGPVSYDLKGEPLKEFLTRFFAEQGMQVVLSPLVESQSGTLNGPRAGSSDEVFRSIASANQLSAYYDGSAVYIYKLNERITRYFAVPTNRVEDFVRAFHEMRLGDSANTFNARADSGLIVVSGAPRFVEQAQELSDTLRHQQLTTAATMRVFPLKYAWASDTSFTAGTREITVPGVASILQQLMYGQDQLPDFGAVRDRAVRTNSVSLKGRGLAAGADYSSNRSAGDLPPLNRPRSSDVVYEDEVTTPSFGAKPLPNRSRDIRIVADRYRNAVIVRDSPDSMALYADLIRQLDVEPQIVQLEATIIDVNKRKLRDIGVDWRWKNARNEVLFGGDETVKQQFLSALGANNVDYLPQRSAGLQLGAIIGDSYKFIARINALADQGVTHVVSRPQVLTLNDVEAVIENTRTLYVPVNGAYEVDLFNVVAGTILRVTPHIVVDGGRQRIRLLVGIEDGDVSISATNSRNQIINYPSVTRAAVNTQALINENESLLLGGLVRNLSGKNVDKIPGLGNVPVLGALFRREAKQQERVERLFLITPRLVPLNSIVGQTPVIRDDMSVESIKADDEAREAAEKREERQRRKQRRSAPITSATDPGVNDSSATLALNSSSEVAQPAINAPSDGHEGH